MFKKGSLSAISRDNILKYTTGIRHDDGGSNLFRSMKPVVKLIKKEEQELNIKGRKMEVLAILRDAGGPFVSFKKVRWVLHASHEE